MIENRIGCNMSCCGKSDKRSIKRQHIAESPKPVIKHVEVRKIQRHSHAATPAANQAQYAVSRVSCPKCGYPAMTVHIAKRERVQCTNTDCKMVIK